MALAMGLLSIAASAAATAHVSGPYVHHNLAVQLVHGRGRDTGEILTLDTDRRSATAQMDNQGGQIPSWTRWGSPMDVRCQSSVQCCPCCPAWTGWKRPPEVLA